MNIQELLNSGAHITFSVDAKDLKDFALAVAAQTRSEIERDIAESRSEIYYTCEQVSNILNVDKTTLWRWSKRDYLTAIKVGGLVRYRKSDIDRILNYGKKGGRHE